MVERARRAWRRGSDAGATPIVALEIRSAVTEAECRALAERARGKRVLEVGSYLGRSTIALASTAAVVHTVDFHPPEDVEGGAPTTAIPLLENLDRYDVRHKVAAHVGYAQVVLPELRRASFELAFLDAQHQREAVEEDLNLVLPLVAAGGTIAFHDYGLPGTEHLGEWHPFGVTEVVDAFAARLGASVEVVETLALVRVEGRRRRRWSRGDAGEARDDRPREVRR
jgi:hypothetical protein